MWKIYVSKGSLGHIQLHFPSTGQYTRGKKSLPVRMGSKAQMAFKKDEANGIAYGIGTLERADAVEAL